MSQQDRNNLIMLARTAIAAAATVACFRTFFGK